jgi:Ca-activated chloride channel family protein
MSRQRYAWLGLLAGLLYAQSAAAELPAFLRKENSHVREGNEQLGKGDAKAALDSYTHAARELPDAPGVQLDRGLALLKQGEFAKARESLLAATQPAAPNDLRADAYEDLSLAFYREADGLAGQNKHDEAQKLFRESVDAAKRSLRLRPGDPNTAWNLELAARRIREEQDKQKQEDDKRKQDEKNKDKDKDKDQKQNQDPDQDQKKPEGDGDQSQKPDKPSDDQKDKPDNKDPQKGEDKTKPEQPPKAPEGQDKQPKPDPAKQDEAKPAEPDPGRALPPEATQALDALEGGEENFERYRARQRAARERRAPEKDW